jgi:hypothetical protein
MAINGGSAASGVFFRTKQMRTKPGYVIQARSRCRCHGLGNKHSSLGHSVKDFEVIIMSNNIENHQEVLFELEPSDGLFLLMPKEELLRVKQYTASSLRKWERLREAIAMLLPWWPLDEIAQKLHVSEKTLREFAARESEKVALSGKELASVCQSAPARAQMIAKAKEHGTTYPQLVLGAKLMIDAAGQLEQTGLVCEEKVLKEDRARLEGMATIRAMLAGLEAQAQVDSEESS